MQRSVTVTRDDRCAGLRFPDLGWGRRPNLHGMHGVRTNSLRLPAVPRVSTSCSHPHRRVRRDVLAELVGRGRPGGSDGASHSHHRSTCSPDGGRDLGVWALLSASNDDNSSSATTQPTQPLPQPAASPRTCHLSWSPAIRPPPASVPGCHGPSMPPMPPWASSPATTAATWPAGRCGWRTDWCPVRHRCPHGSSRQPPCPGRRLCPPLSVELRHQTRAQLVNLRAGHIGGHTRPVNSGQPRSQAVHRHERRPGLTLSTQARSMADSLSHGRGRVCTWSRLARL